jgi:hypothetical protein
MIKQGGLGEYLVCYLRGSSLPGHTVHGWKTNISRHQGNFAAGGIADSMFLL